MRFTKMHGLGNDYLYVYGEPKDPEALSIKLSDRHFGAGSDGMIWISPSTVADFKMRIFNADGSEAKMCGNGIRCVGKYVYDKGYTDKKRLTVETLSGIRTLDLQVSGGKVKSVSVDMGKAIAEEEKKLCIDGQEITYLPVSVGNPHAVIFTEDVSQVPLAEIGPKIEHHPDFPGGVNVEFVEVLGQDSLRMRVWERGSGITMACGTGACASAAAAVKKGFCRFDSPISVQLDGGILKIQVGSDAAVRMTGPAETIYEGEADL
ncbi:diaminopimelate epimerase [Ructibacterium gallinarum]|uniref:Diaminopimelate epimerase n=1 Tax=Ructibacterium gallinarum TaxID=2779355 RepID=A0A9D5R7B1_9FIRM|nr:diaminopimelate epimerase [Ructibacterium gallinarum]MBE5038966.1 diaminopimelate epimerase [Ructibacterium gallinarum]